MVDCLVEYDSYGNVEPALATSWEQNEDATVWTFHIREGVNWVDKDGNVVAPVTANDWVSSAHYACDANNDSDTFYTMSGVIAGADAYYDWTAYQMALPDATDGTDKDGNAVKFITNEDGEQEILEEVPEASIDDIGVKAVDDYTLEFTLESSRPYFLSMVSFGPYMPVYGPFLAECGSKFGTDNSTLLYCGAFILSTYEPQQQRVLTKNPTYWDKDNVFLDAIQMTYNAEASSIATTMYQSGEVDQADISSDLLSAMMADPNTKDLIHPSRADTSYAYWYLFNFDPNFDAEYEPENWKLAVNNENFRKSIVHAFNRMPALATSDRIDPESLKNNTITPNAFASASKDYTYYEGLAAYTDGDNFDEALAEEYKTTAIEELTAAGATFPIKMLMCYNPTSANWAQECQVVEQQIENVLGADYVDIIIRFPWRHPPHRQLRLHEVQLGRRLRRPRDLDRSLLRGFQLQLHLQEHRPRNPGSVRRIHRAGGCRQGHHRRYGRPVYRLCQGRGVLAGSRLCRPLLHQQPQLSNVQSERL